jgi:hypothetical protein
MLQTTVQGQRELVSAVVHQDLAVVPSRGAGDGQESGVGRPVWQFTGCGIQAERRCQACRQDGGIIGLDSEEGAESAGGTGSLFDAHIPIDRDCASQWIRESGYRYAEAITGVAAAVELHRLRTSAGGKNRTPHRGRAGAVAMFQPRSDRRGRAGLFC